MRLGLRRRRLTLAVAAFAACPSLAAESGWIRLRTPNFELYSSAGQRSARDTIRQFEQVRTFFLQAFHSGSAARATPIRLVAFNSAKEYEPYRLNEYATAYYQQTPDRDYIVMSRAGSDIFPVAVHEYVHLLVRHAGVELPVWLNEGLAELYSTLRPMGDKIVIGDLIRGRHQALLESKWVPLATIVSADQSSAYYNEKNKAGSLYNEAWALTHMLCLRAEYRPKFGELIRAISAGTQSLEALQETYGRSLPEIEKDLQSYLRGTSFQGVLVAAKLEKSSGAIPAEPLEPFDLGLMFADLSYRRGKEAGRKAALEKLVATDPKRPESYRALAYLAWQSGDREEAMKQFGKAFECGDRDPKLLWDYGRLSESEKPSEAIRILTELLAQEPNRNDVRIDLAEAQVRSDQPKAALATLAPIRRVTPEESRRFFRVLVFANLRNSDPTNAEKAAKRFREIATTDEDRAEAEMLVRQTEPRQIVEGLTPPPDTSEGGQAEDASSAAPPKQLRERALSPAQERTQRSERPSVSGRFVELQCGGKQARMVIETGNGRKVFLIEDPARVAITAGATGPVDMTCGIQKNAVRVEIGFERKAAMAAGVDGVVRTLAF